MTFDARAMKLLQAGQHITSREFPGLRLEATEHFKTWTYRYKSPVDGRMRQAKIGRWPAMSLHAAQRAAEEVAARLPALVENEQALREFAEWRDFYATARGMSMADAIRAAADRMAPQFEQPAKAAAPDPATDTRTQKAIERGAETSARQPPPIGESGTGNRTAPPIPKIETQEDWDKLPEKERERLLMGG